MPEPSPTPSLGAHYDEVVSLGCHCQPTHQIRRILGLTAAHVFDWIITTDSGLVVWIESRLAGFFARERLTHGSHGYVIDLPTDTRFVHEFPQHAAIDETYDQQVTRLRFLADRWHALMASHSRVLFVRVHAWQENPRASAVRLRDAIRTTAPGLSFTLLYLTADRADDQPWHEPGIVNRHLPRPEPYRWEGDDGAWEDLLGVALARPPAVMGSHTGS